MRTNVRCSVITCASWSTTSATAGSLRSGCARLAWAIATRYDKLAVSYHTWLILAALLLWLPDEPSDRP